MFNNYSSFYPQRSIKKINFSSILDGTQKTLSIINQAIPIIYQLKPLYQNAKTAMKVVNAIKNDTPVVNKTSENKKIEPSNNGPTYFL